MFLPALFQAYDEAKAQKKNEKVEEEKIVLLRVLVRAIENGNMLRLCCIFIARGHFLGIHFRQATEL